MLSNSNNSLLSLVYVVFFVLSLPQASIAQDEEEAIDEIEVVAKARLDQLRERAKANLEAGAIELSDEEMRRIDGIASPDGKLIDPPGLSPIWGRAN